MSATRRATFAPGANGAPLARGGARTLVDEHDATVATLRPCSARPLREWSHLTAQVHRCADPALMTHEARIAELGEIFAIGYRRLSLALNRDPEAQCDVTP